MTRTNERGFTLLELLLVIGVAALLLIGGIATHRLVSDGNRATESTRLLLTLRQETQTMAQQQGGNYNGLNFSSADTNPTPLVNSGVLRLGQRNPFNGPITITPVPDANGVADANVTVQFDNISQSGCGKLAVSVNNANEVVSVTINGGTAMTTFPITASDAATACNAATNSIVWQFP